MAVSRVLSASVLVRLLQGKCSSRTFWLGDRPVAPQQRQRYSTSASGNSDYSKELDEINSKFAEARDEIEMALESKETVYFNEEVETAKVAVNEVLQKYTALLGRLDSDEKGAVQRSMGLKMEQLKAEFAQLKE